ncbi:MAG: CvpA family protein [bacterium]|nr:CvpA family protein [bacterium]
MNIFDIVIILLILLSGVTGLKQGLLKSGINLIGTILIYIIAFKMKDSIGLFLCKVCPFFKFNGYITLNILVYQLIAFVLIASILFSVFAIVLKLTGIVQKLVDLTVILTIPSKIGGFIIGLLEGYVVMFIIILILSVPLRNVELFSQSKLVDKMINNTPILSSTLDGVGDVIFDVFHITSEVKEGENENTKVNIDIMKTYLDYKIISKEDAIDLVDMGKLNSINGMRTFVDNYQ